MLHQKTVCSRFDTNYSISSNNLLLNNVDILLTIIHLSITQYYRLKLHWKLAIRIRCVYTLFEQTLQDCEEAVSLTEENEATGKAADRINREAKDWLKKSQECKTKLHEDFEAKLADDLHTPSILNAALQEAKKKTHKELQISIKSSLADRCRKCVVCSWITFKFELHRGFATTERKSTENSRVN